MICKSLAFFYDFIVILLFFFFFFLFSIFLRLFFFLGNLSFFSILFYLFLFGFSFCNLSFCWLRNNCHYDKPHAKYSGCDPFRLSGVLFILPQPDKPDWRYQY